jgi:6-pyruvoyltetrahydropterin/6-carboxytetrahydropterin synthase
MYLVTKRIEFCYGHRLLDYEGVCKHPHGHNAVVEVDVSTATLDNRNMVADFSDIKRIVKGWIDRELDHKMILRHDDPLVDPLKKLGEPIYILDSNPTVERIARLIFDKARELGINVVSIRVWETPSSFASYSLPGQEAAGSSAER